MFNIVIPTCKPVCDDFEDLIIQIRDTAGVNPIVTNIDASASVNRNDGLSKCDKKYVIMMDDDIIDLKQGWAEELLYPLINNEAVMTSARLINKDGTLAYMLSEENNDMDRFIQVGKRELPTACVAFKNDGVRFDENFIGSGFEDNDFCKQLQIKYPEGRFVICNRCRVVHINEKKNQHGSFWDHNKKYYENKWINS